MRAAGLWAVPLRMCWLCMCRLPALLLHCMQPGHIDRVPMGLDLVPHPFSPTLLFLRCSAWNFWLPVSPNYICPNATLTVVSDIPKGAEGCQLEDCLACAGIDGCYCDGCACVCSL